MLLFFQTKNQKEKIKSTRQQVTEYWTMWGLFQKTQENLKKNGFFRTILAILWSKQPSLVKNWPFLAVFGHFWPSFVIFGQNSPCENWPFLAILPKIALVKFGHFWLFVDIFGHFCHFGPAQICLFAFWSKQPSEFGYFWPFLDVFGQHPLVSQKKTIHTEKFLPIKTYYPDKKCIL